MPPCHLVLRRDGFESRPDRKSCKSFYRIFLFMYFVYILYSASRDVYYKGFSENVERRLLYHLESKSKYTSGTNDWKIVYMQEFENKSHALIEEKRLKKLNRTSLEKLIKR
ncbi:GIY-YIG nuclease family protein [Chryseobacterium sp. SORGH_AS_0447]